MSFVWSCLVRIADPPLTFNQTMSCLISSRLSLTFRFTNSFFLRQELEKGARVVYLVWNLSRCRSTQPCYILSYVSWRRTTWDGSKDIVIYQMKFRTYFWHQILTFLNIKSPVSWLLLTSLECWREITPVQASTKLNIQNIFTFVSNESEILGESELENLIIGFLLSFLCHFDFIHPTQCAKCIYLPFFRIVPNTWEILQRSEPF